MGALMVLEALRLSRSTLLVTLRWTMPALALLLVWIAVATTAGLWPDQSRGYTVWLVATIVFAVAVVHSTVRVASITAWLAWVTTAAAAWAVVVVVSVPLSLVLPNLRQSETPSGLPRVTGPLTEPSFLALYLLPLVFLALVARRPIMAMVIAVGVLASTSRLGVIGLVAGGLVIGVLALIQYVRAPHRGRAVREWVRPAAIGTAVLAVLALVAWRLGYFDFITSAADLNETSSSAPRLASWQRAGQVVGSTFPSGAGPGGYPQAAYAIGIGDGGAYAKTTNLPLEVLAELGLLGVISLALWFIWPIIGAWRRGIPGHVRNGVTAGMVAVLVVSPLFQTWQRPYTWLFWALAVAAVAAAARERTR
jgi:O-antigen ligase